MDLARFKERLRETIAWCEGRADAAEPAHSLRTPLLKPPSFVWPRARRYQAQHPPPGPDFFDEDRESRARGVEALARARASALPYRSAMSDGLAGGRLLLYDPEENLVDGIAELDSDGFFDLDNCPPWDTWIGYVEHARRPDARYHHFESYLVSWVPPSLLPAASVGVDVNPAQCIVWATALDSEFTRALARAHLLG